MVKPTVTVCNDIYIEMRMMHKHLDRGDVMLRVHPEVVKQLKSSGAKWLQEMEEMVGKTILVKSGSRAASGAVRHPLSTGQQMAYPWRVCHFCMILQTNDLPKRIFL